MKKNLLFINSESDSLALVPLFQELISNNYSLFFLAQTRNGIESANNFKKLNIKKLNSVIFIILIPALFVYFFFLLAYYKYKKNIDYIISLDFRERIFIPPLAKIFQIKNVWLELPGKNYKKERRE